MGGNAFDTFGGLRGFLEDLIAPSVSRLDVRVEMLAKRYDDLGANLSDLREAHHQFVAYMAEQLAALNSRIGHLEGRSDGLKAELTATLQIEILKASQRSYPFRRRPGALPPAGEPDLE